MENEPFRGAAFVALKSIVKAPMIRTPLGLYFALVLKLADRHVSEACAARRGGSSPLQGIKKRIKSDG